MNEMLLYARRGLNIKRFVDKRIFEIMFLFTVPVFPLVFECRNQFMVEIQKLNYRTLFD